MLLMVLNFYSSQLKVHALEFKTISFFIEDKINGDVRML